MLHARLSLTLQPLAERTMLLVRPADVLSRLLLASWFLEISTLTGNVFREERKHSM